MSLVKLSDVVSGAIAGLGELAMGSGQKLQMESAGRAFFYSVAARYLGAKSSIAENNFVGEEASICVLLALAYEGLVSGRGINQKTAVKSVLFGASDRVADEVVSRSLGGDRFLV